MRGLPRWFMMEHPGELDDLRIFEGCNFQGIPSFSETSILIRDD